MSRPCSCGTTRRGSILVTKRTYIESCAEDTQHHCCEYRYQYSEPVLDELLAVPEHNLRRVSPSLFFSIARRRWGTAQLWRRQRRLDQVVYADTAIAICSSTSTSAAEDTHFGLCRRRAQHAVTLHERCESNNDCTWLQGRNAHLLSARGVIARRHWHLRKDASVKRRM